MSDKKKNKVQKIEKQVKKKIEKLYGKENDIVFNSFVNHVNKEYKKQEAALIYDNYITLRKNALKKVIKIFCH